MKASFPFVPFLFIAFGCSSESPASKTSTLGGNCPDASAFSGSAAPASDSISMPGGQTGIGFDDLIYSARLHRVLVPGGWTGYLNLVNPDTLDVTSISGFSTEASWTDGDDTKGVGTVDEGNGLVFVGDRTTSELGVVDPVQKKILTKVKLASYPDYVRYVEGTGEVWVSEPFAGQIEVLRGAREGNPVHDALIPVPRDDGGAIDVLPEALVIDQTRGLALTLHLFRGQIVAIDVKTRSVIGSWSTGCDDSHGLVAVDEKRGFVFPGCLTKARAAVVDLNGSGAVLDSFDLGTGSTLVAFSSKLNHFYMRGDPGTPLGFFGVSNSGKLTHFLTFDMTFGAPQKSPKAHCLAADDVGGVWSCDWYSGAILRYKDSLPSCSE